MEVTVKGPLYEVTVTEYEAGWGQRVDPADTKIFTSLEEAEAYKARCEEGGTYGCFWRATIRKFG